MAIFLDPEPGCWKDDFKPRLAEIVKKPFFNVGAYVVNLKRFKDLEYRATIELWVERNTKCRLYKGHTQPPLILAMYAKGGKDFIHLSRKHLKRIAGYYY